MLKTVKAFFAKFGAPKEPVQDELLLDRPITSTWDLLDALVKGEITFRDLPPSTERCSGAGPSPVNISVAHAISWSPPAELPSLLHSRPSCDCVIGPQFVLSQLYPKHTQNGPGH